MRKYVYFVVLASLTLLFLCNYMKASNVRGITYPSKPQVSKKVNAVPVFLDKDMPIPPPPPRVNNQLIKIAIIDTGYAPPLDGSVELLKLCDKGHYNFDTDTPTVGAGTSEHGTIIGSIIADMLKDVNYCAIIYNVQVMGSITSRQVTGAVNMASKEGLAAVNISLEGKEYSFYEKLAIKNLASKGTLVFVAAGNRRLDFNDTCSSYPSCYRLHNVIPVGAMDEGLEYRASYSNYGAAVTTWYRGDVSWGGERVQGTSFASPKVLAACVLFCVTTSGSAVADSKSDAVNSAARAFYRQAHLDETADYMQKHFIDTNVSKEWQNTAVWCSILIKAVQDEYISYTWRF